MKLDKKIIQPKKLKTLMAILHNSVGIKIFRHFYAEIEDKEKDIMKGGDLSCAFFVSGILTMLSLLDHIHGTVDGTVSALLKHGWKKTTRLRPGNILVWEEIKTKDGSRHKHIGFYLGNQKAISNDSKSKILRLHHYTFGESSSSKFRKIIAMYFHSDLKDND